jgi:hypothetical protein
MSEDLAYQGTTYDIIAKLQEKFNLRPSNKSLPTIPTKKILPMGEIDEVAPKVVDKQTEKTQTADTQPIKSKSVGTLVMKTQVPVSETKSAPQRKSEMKGIEAPNIESDKALGNFSLENEINKIKIPIPLVELAKNPIYRKQIAKKIIFLEEEIHADIINLEDDMTNIVFGPHFEGVRDTLAPFYITLTLFEHLLHNCMPDSGASHNVMPKAIMEKLGLEITRPYGDLYSFDSRRVKCIGMIKDLVVGRAQIPAKSILMGIVVTDIPPKYGMILSRSWGAKLGGSLQLDMTYATILVFGGQYTCLYRETRLEFIVGDPHNPNNHPVYIADKDLGNCILSIDNDF